ncbi:MAG: CPBP family intramembrane metalloprotease [Candidatus Lokiarchaeota archaeon]|nr:CPBP family intramembrane metalloprotease [Candidatus Lokiarchaeota archaeon]
MSSDLRSRLFTSDDPGFNFGLVAITLVVITIIFPVYVDIGVEDPRIDSFWKMFISGLVMTFILSLSLALLKIRKSKRQNAKDLVIFDFTNPIKQIYVIILGIVGGVFIVTANILATTSSNLLLSTTNATGFYLGLLAGVAEELFFRGFLQTFFELLLQGTVFARFFAIIPTAIVFALFHAFTPSGLEFGTLLILFIIGVGLGILQAVVNDIGVSMLAHIFNNLIATLGTATALFVIDPVVLIIGVVLAVFFFMLSYIFIPRRRR